MRDGLDLSNLEEKTAYINTVLKEVKQEDDEIKQEFLLKKISLEFDIDVNILKNTLKKWFFCYRINYINNTKEDVKA